MIPIEIRIKGLTVIKDIRIPFHEISGDIIAITGKNGQGKTSFLESIFMSLYRALPSRPNGTYKYFHGRDSLIDFKFDWHGKVFESVINIDATYEKMEAFLYDDHQEPVKGITGKTRDFDTLVEKSFGSPGLILASSFAAQTKRGSFISLPKSDRKILFISMLDLGILQDISRESSKELSECDDKLSTLREQYQSREEKWQKTVLFNVDELKSKLQAVEKQIEISGQHAKQLLQKSTELATVISGYDSIFSRVTEEKRRIIDFKNKKKSLTDRLDQALSFISSAPDIDKAVSSLELVRSQEHQLRTEISKLHALRRDLAQQKSSYDEQTAKYRQEYLIEQAALKMAKSKKEDAEKDAAIIDQVPCKAEGEFANCQFLLNAVEKKGAMESLEVEILNRTQAMLRIQDAQAQLPKPPTAALDNCDKQIREKEEEVNRVHNQIYSLEKIASLAPALQEAKAKVIEINEQLETIDRGINDASLSFNIAYAELTKVEESKKAVDQAQKDLAEAEQQETRIIFEKDILLTQISTAEASNIWHQKEGQEIYKINQSIGSLERDRREWDLLARAFGPNGIQSLEIDAAGPTVSSLANDLLFSCFGPRFSIKFITQELKADGSGFKDEFDIHVIDADNGRDGSIDDLSGGEKVVVGEAVSLAIAIFNKMKNGISWQTLFRDEVSGALDDDAATRYITMLRRAREIGHFVKVFFIAHQPRLHELADSRINFINGQAEIIS